MLTHSVRLISVFIGSRMIAYQGQRRCDNVDVPGQVHSEYPANVQVLGAGILHRILRSISEARDVDDLIARNLLPLPLRVNFRGEHYRRVRAQDMASWVYGAGR